MTQGKDRDSVSPRPKETSGFQRADETETQLRESERRLREASELARLGYWHWDVKTGAVEWSDQVFAIFGLDPDEYTPHIDSIMELSPWPEDYRRDEELRQRAIETREAGSYDQRFLLPDGSVGYYHSTFQGVFDGDELVEIVGTVMDITERKRLEESLRLKNQVFEDSIAAMGVADPNGVVTEVNSAVLEMLEYSSEEDVIGKPMDSFFANREEAASVLEELNRTGRWEGEVEALRADGTTFTTRGLATVLRNDRGEILGYHSANIDVTEQKLAEEQLHAVMENLERLVEERSAEAIEASQAKSEFLAAMSHELRTPLNSIIGFSGLLLGGAPGELNEEQRRQQEMILASGRRLLALVDDILDLAKIEAHGVSLDIRETDINETCGEAVEQVRPQAEEKGIELVFSQCPEECPLCGRAVMDEGKLTQIVLNLLSNAVKFTDAGRVELQIGCTGEKTAFVRVIDTGVGIAEDALDQIFEEFEQIAAHDEAKPVGTGLGLPISRRLANLMGGELTVESTLGEGSVFTVMLPLQFAEDSSS